MVQHCSMKKHIVDGASSLAPMIVHLKIVRSDCRIIVSCSLFDFCFGYRVSNHKTRALLFEVVVIVELVTSTLVAVLE